MVRTPLLMATRSVCTRSRHLLALCLVGLLGTSSSADATPSQPSIGGVAFSNVTVSSALLYGNVNPNGAPTSYYFQYGATTAYGSQTPLSSAGNGTIGVKVSQAVTGLAPATTYHFRLVATNSVARVNSADHLFTTARVPLSFQVAGVPDPVVFGSPFAIQGTLSGTGAAGHTVALQVNPFPYVGGMRWVGSPEVIGANGSFSFPVVGLLENARFRVVTVDGAFVSSPVITESVAVRVTLHARRVHRHHGHYYRLYGTVVPAEAGARVGFQLLRPGSKSVNEGGAIVKTGAGNTSRFSQVVRIRHPGLYSALVAIKDGSHAAGYSMPLRIR